MAATVDESTPPDIATATVWSLDITYKHQEPLSRLDLRRLPQLIDYSPASRTNGYRPLATGDCFFCHTGDSSRSRATVAGMMESANSISFSVVCFPKLNRKLARACSGGKPIAVST